jgi:hypothetical protein
MRLLDRQRIIQERLLTVGVCIISFVLYLTTMCRSVSFIDAGELAAVAGVLGIAHPTGYPFYTLLAHAGLWFSFGNEPVVVLNVFSSIIVSAAIGVLFRVLLVVARLADSRGPSANRSQARAGSQWGAALVSLTVGFSSTVWSQSVAVEVYGLHVLLVMLTILTFLKGFEEDSENKAYISRYLVAAAFLLGLSFTNHLTTLLLIPALVTMEVQAHGLGRHTVRCSLKLFPFFLIGLSLYLYLPIRAASRPPVEWGYPAEMERLLWHVSGKQYRSWMFSSFESAEKQLSYFFANFPSEYNWLVVALIVYGIVRAFKVSRTMFWFAVVAFLSCVVYAINYDIHDIDSYFLLAYIAVGIFLFFGTMQIVELIARSRALAIVGTLCLLVLPALQILNNHGRVNESDDFLTEDYTHNILNNTLPNGVIFTFQWDYFVSPSLYYQCVRNERPDVTVIDKELLRRSWYFIHLRNKYPWLMEKSRERVDAFLTELHKFEHDLPYDPQVIEKRYVEMINDLIDKSMETRPVYVGPEIEPEFGARYARVPSGLMFRLAGVPDTVVVESPKITYRPASIQTRLTEGIRSLYARMLTATGGLFLSKNRDSEARSCIEQALAIDPTYKPAQSLHAKLSQQVGD